LCIAIGAVLAVLAVPATAGAVTTLRTITVDHSGTPCASINPQGQILSTMSQTGIAFDGSALYMSCWGDNSIVKASPSNGSQLGLEHISGASELGALAWDWKRHVLWACSLTPGHEQTSTQVGTIDLSAATFTPVFNALGCDNGLAYDFTDDTLWASQDVATTIEHYTTTGGLISSRSIGTTALQNSGIAVGTSDLYLANPTTTTKRIFQVDRGLGSAALFATLNLRYEDMECDGETFSGKTALWVQTNRSNVVRAYQIPNDTCAMPVSGASLTLGQQASPPTSFPVGEQVTYTATVTNGGSADATSTTLTDTVPALAVLDSAIASQGSCSGSGPVTCNLGTIPAGGSATVTLVATPVTNETASSTASVTSPDAPAAGPVTASAKATPVALVKYVKVTASSFSPSPTTLAAPGWTVQWYFTGSTPLAATDSSGMGLFDSGVRMPVDFYDFTFTAAGSYPVTDGPMGKKTSVKVPLAVAPASGSQATTYTITWASAPPPAGFGEDVQVKDPGSSAWVTLPFDPSATSGTFVPDHGKGTYSFRARLRNTGNNKASGYSATKTISVS
jgi:uncharacterized repeat protein (TIGR01451 family)